MKRFLTGLTLAALLALAGPQPAFALYVTGASALAGNPIHVTVFDGNDVMIANANVTWTMATGAALPSTLTVTADPAGGFVFYSSVTGASNVKATVGAASATFLLNFLGLKFTSP